MLTRLGLVRWRRVIAWGLVCCLGLAGLVMYLFGGSGWLGGDPVFRGKRESEWIRNLREFDYAQVKEWRGFGEEGMEVLMRGFQKANSPRKRAYRKVYAGAPVVIRRVLPVPDIDAEMRRYCIVFILGGLGENAKGAADLMIDAVLNDESEIVQASAISYFTGSRGEECLLNQLSEDRRKVLLEGLLRGAKRGNVAVRHNAVAALRCYPEEEVVVVPTLVASLKDPDMRVRLQAVEVLSEIAPEVAQRLTTSAVLREIAQGADEEAAMEAVTALVRTGGDDDFVVGWLIGALKSSKTMLAFYGLKELERLPERFRVYSEVIVPAITAAQEREDGAGSYARFALEEWEERMRDERGDGRDAP